MFDWYDVPIEGHHQRRTGNAGQFIGADLGLLRPHSHQFLTHHRAVLRAVIDFAAFMGDPRYQATTQAMRDDYDALSPVSAVLYLLVIGLPLTLAGVGVFGKGDSEGHEVEGWGD